MMMLQAAELACKRRKSRDKLLNARVRVKTGYKIKRAYKQRLYVRGFRTVRQFSYPSLGLRMPTPPMRTDRLRTLSLFDVDPVGTGTRRLESIFLIVGGRALSVGMMR